MMSLAEDVTQVVFIRFAKTPPDIKTPGELAAWLHRTTTHVAIDAWRAETRRRNREQQAVAMESTTDPSWKEISSALDQAVNQLADEDREAILLRFFRRKTMRDVGAALGVSEAAAKMRVVRAVERLRKRLGVEGMACTAAVLGTVLAERSVEAAPAALVARLATIHLPTLAASGAKGGLVQALTRVSKLKMVAVASLSVVWWHFVHSSRGSGPVMATQASADANAMPGNERTISLNDTSSIEAPNQPTKILLHVLDADTARGLSETKIHFVYYGAGGETESHDTLTDENGDARLQAPDDPTKNSAPNVYVAAEGHVPQMVSPLTNVYTVRLDSAMTIGGAVVDKDGAPVTGVAIYFEGPWNQSRQTENVAFKTFPVTSHEDGRWLCSYIPKGCTNEIRLTLDKAGYALSSKGVPIQDKDPANLVLTIDPGAIVTGRIMDQHNHPISEASVRVLASSGNKRQMVRSDADGVFTLTGVGDQALAKFSNLIPLGPCQAQVAVQADGYAPDMKIVQLTETNITNVVNFALAPGNYFRGRVVDDFGNPIPNVVVQTDYAMFSDRSFDWTTHTDGNGFFQWDSAPSEATTYWFDAEGYEAIRFKPMVADGTDHEITLKHKVGE